MANHSPASLSDSELLAEIARAAGIERHSTAGLLALLAEVDTRKLYLGVGYSSLFVYCIQALHLSESAAYARITAARASRSFPIILTLLAEGVVTLTTVSLLAAHLTDENHETLLGAASHKSRRAVEQLVAGLVSQPDVESSLRRLPDRRPAVGQTVPTERPSLLSISDTSPDSPTQPTPIALSTSARRSVIAPLGAERYLLRVTLTARGHDKLERARALLRHHVPNGDPAVIVERALSVLVDRLERTKCAATRKPRTGNVTTVSTTRHVPAAVKRAVWARDGGQCAFVGIDGRCDEVGFLEFHHVTPFAEGGSADLANLQLRCRAHNAYEVTLFEQSAVPSSLQPKDY